MREVGVKELKSGLSDYLRLVARGEHVRVTLRGRPVAELVPATDGESNALTRARAAGRVTPARAPKRTPPPLVGGPSASAEILAERAEDR
jgi:prevent-host-death family protein